ncbi:TB2/DP1, HVA22 family-domain-containing protein [Phascolomyces articulosus]|uniref:Protein YOP1 n=1 Tax=Phascolomyces articulosus TaxID=60185 RepID=A0AAD5K8S5_9FUNG|nr:TB2/DP1, HVA22 family-domain-containing protein [Phascolomyces articulosus]
MSESHHVDHEERGQQFHATSSAIERLLDALNRQSPINLEFITRPFNKAFNGRVYSLELIYAKSRLFRFLVRKGVNPILLFVSLTAGMAGALRRFYKESSQLALNLLGVVYPAWQCWQLVKEQHTHDNIQREREYKSWLTYWMIYGTFQVLDNWTYDILSLFPNYNMYKLAILYWLQNPHSNGASLLCHQVIQKPIYPDPPVTPTATTYSIPSSPESHHADDDQLTLTIEQPKSGGTPTTASPSPPHLPTSTTTSILDGYTPTLQPRTPPSIISNSPSEKQDQPYSLLEAESAW